MRIKIFIIITLMAAIFVSAVGGTLSCYTASSNYGAYFEPDSDKIIARYKAMQGP
jgi:hypothetical protein